MSFFALMNWRIWAAGVLALALAGTHWGAYVSGKKTVKADWNAEKLSVAEQSLKLSEEATRVTADLQTKADTLRKSKNAQIARLNADLAIALGGLSDRAPRPGAVDLSSNSTIGSGCTGRELYRPDGEFLARESARAERLRLDLWQCQAAYQAARDALK